MIATTSPMQITSREVIAQVNPEEVLGIYVASGGLVQLALERINRRFFPSYDPITNPTAPRFDEVALHLTLTAPNILNRLQDATRAQIIMQTYEATVSAISNLKAKMAFLDPFDASKTATNLLTQLEALTQKPHQTNITNYNEFVWEHEIPQEAVEAIKYLKANPTNNQPGGNTPQHNSSDIIEDAFWKVKEPDD